MKRFKWIGLLLIMIASTFVLAGCGGELSTTMSIDDQFAGTRTMVYTVDTSSNSDSINGSVDDITAEVESNCPSELSFTSSVDGNILTYTFTLDFSSLEDYEKKVTALLTAGEVEVPDQIIDFAMPDSIFASGVRYEEHVSSDQMMQWFENLLVNGGYVSSSDRGYILGETGDEKLVLNDAVLDEDDIYADTVKYHEIRGINIYTSLNSDGTYDRTIELMVPGATISELDGQVEEFMKSTESSVATGEWTAAGGISTYTVTGEGLSAEEVNTMTAAFCGNPEGKVFQINSDPSAMKGKNLLFDTRNISESLDLQNYISNSYGDVALNYYVSDNANYSGTIEDVTGSYDFETTADSESENGYYLLQEMDRGYTSDFRYAGVLAMELSSLDMALTVNDADAVEREVELVYDVKADKEMVKTWDEKLKAAMKDTAMSLEKCEAKDDGMHIVIKTSGAPKDDAAAWKKVFALDNSLSVAANSRSLFAPSYRIDVMDNFSMGAFTTGTIPNVRYEVKGLKKVAGSPSSMEKGSYVQEYTSVGQDNAITVSLSGTKTNMIAFAIYGGAALAILIIVLVIALVGKKKRKGIQTASDDAI